MSRRIASKASYRRMLRRRARHAMNRGDVFDRIVNRNVRFWEFLTNQTLTKEERRSLWEEALQ